MKPNDPSTSLTPESWARYLLKKLRIPESPGAIAGLVGWEKADGGHWKNSAKYNPLNTTQPMSGAGNTGSQGNIKVYKNWSQGLDATVKTLQNGNYEGILHALKSGDTRGLAAAIGQSPWGTNADLVNRTIGSPSSIQGQSSDPLPPLVSNVASSGGNALGTSWASSSTPSLIDVLSQYRNATQPRLLPSDQQAPQQQAGFQNPNLFKGSTILQNVIPMLQSLGQPPGGQQQAPSSPVATTAALGSVTGPKGDVSIFNGDPGRLKPYVVDFAQRLSGRLGRKLSIDSGANHSKYTVNGNVSEHYTGNATDMPMSGAQLTTAGQQALIEAGADPKWAHAQKGGLYNITAKDGTRYQIIFNTTEGGNHWNHLHVGIRPGR